MNSLILGGPDSLLPYLLVSACLFAAGILACTTRRNAVGYLTESMHGAGSPQAQRIQIGRQMDLGYKKALAKRLAGVQGESAGSAEPAESARFKAMFEPTE